MPVKIRITFGVLIFLFCANISLAQQYSYRHYTILDGLVQNQVTALFQDSKGYVWIGTKGGVSRFDGMLFKNFTVADGIAKGQIIKFFELNNKLYCYSSGGISVLRENRFQQMFEFRSPNNGNIYITPDFTKVYFAFNNQILLANKNGVRNIYTEKNKSWISIFGSNSGKDDLIVYTEDGLSRYENGKVYPIIKDLKIKEVISCSNTLFFILSKSSANDSLQGIYKLINNKPTKIYKGITNSNFRIIGESIEGRIFGQTDFSNWKVIDTNGILIDQDSLPNIMCNQIIHDREGNYWLGTETGLFVTQSFAFRNYGEKSGIPPYNWSIMESRDSSLIFASYYGDLCKMKNNKVSIIPKSKYQLKSDRDFHFYMNGFCNSRGDWVLPTNHGINLLYDGKKFNRITVHTDHTASAFCIFEDSCTNKIYSGTNYGLSSYGMDDHVVKFYPLPGQNVLFMEKDKFNRKWVCTSARVYLFENDSLKELNLPGFKNESGVTSCKRDQVGNMWLATRNGLFLYNWKQYLKISGDQYFFLSLYKNQFLIAGTITGFLYIDLDAFYAMKPDCWKFFDRFNGFTGIECGQNGTCIDSKGNVWIPTSESVVKFMPDKLRKNTLPPKLNVYSFEISGKDLTWENILNEYSDIKKTTELTYDKHNVKISYMGISLSCPEKVRYKTRLVGYENSWSEPTGEVMAVYTNLPPGPYTFEILACNADKVWTSEPLQVKFKIHPAFWQTWWFYPGIVLIIIVLMLLAFRWQLKRIKKQAQVKQKMAQLEMDLLHMQIKPHFTGNSLMMIKDLIYNRKYEKALEAVDRFGVMLKFVSETTTERYITLEEELLILKNYINFQRLKPDNSIEFEINIAENVIVSEVMLPPILLQPFVENSIDHGLKHKKGDGLIRIDINIDKENSDYILISIFDNGVGRKNVSKFEPDKGKHKSIGIQNSTERLRNFNNSSFSKNIEIIDREDGTEVRIWLKKEV